MKILGTLMLVFLLVGCSRTNITEVMKAMGEDKNAWCLKGNLGTVYGTEANFIAKGSSDTSVEVGPDKCVITGSGVQKQIQIPATVAPIPMNLTPAKP